MNDGLEGSGQEGPTPPPDGGRREQDEADGGGGLAEVLEQSRALGFLGPGPVADHLRHARVFAAALRAQPPTPVDGEVRVLDLGSGGGLPGLVLAADPGFAGWRWVLADAAERRTTFLAEAVAGLGLGDTSVVRGRAEELGRDPALRARFSAVVSRSFGSPAVTAECAAPFLAVGGVLCVSEPPETDADDRWPAAGLAELGLAWQGLVTEARATVAVLRAEAPCGDRYPRRTGVPSKRPLF